MAFDALATLRSGGQPIDHVTGSQRAVLAALSEEEVAILNSIKARVDAAGGEVTAQEEVQGVVIF